MLILPHCKFYQGNVSSTHTAGQRVTVGGDKWVKLVWSAGGVGLRLRLGLGLCLVSALRFRSSATVSVLLFRSGCRECRCRSRTIGEWACRIVNSPAGPVGWPASFSRFQVGGAPGLLATATANLRKRRTLFLYVSYRILTDERNSYVLLLRSTQIRLRMNGNGKGGNQALGTCSCGALHAKEPDQ